MWSRRRLALALIPVGLTGTGAPAPYVPDLERVAPELARSGEVTPLEVFGLRFVRSRERLGAAVAGAGPYPVVLLSPGNGTNVESYRILPSTAD